MYERKDAFYKKAKREGYRARSAYKLIELNQEFRFLRSGMLVVDLGSWPGGWVQVAAEIVGRSGKVVGIDLVAVEPLPFSQVTLLQGNAIVRGKKSLFLPAWAVRQMSCSRTWRLNSAALKKSTRRALWNCVASLW